MKDFRVLIRKFDFMMFVLGGIITQFGSDMVQFAIGLYVLELTGSAGAFAGVLSVIAIPRIILSPFAGVLADRIDRKKLLMALNFSNALVILSYGIYYMGTGAFSLWMLYLLVIYLEIVEVFYSPASTSVFPSILDNHLISSANSFYQTFYAMSGIASTIVAAFVYQYLPIQMILIIASILYVLAMLSKLPLVLPHFNKTSQENKSSILGDMKDAIRYLNENPTMWKLVLFAGVINLFLGPIFVISWPYFIKQVADLPSIYLGYSQAVFAAGMVLGGIVSYAVNAKFKLGTVFFGTLSISALLFGVMSMILTILFYQMGQVFLAYIGMTVIIFILALTIVSVNVAIGTFIQSYVPLDIIGRVSTVIGMIAGGAMPLGNLIYGYLGDKLNLAISFALPAIVIALMLVIFNGLGGELNQMVMSKQTEEKATA